MPTTQPGSIPATESESNGALDTPQPPPNPSDTADLMVGRRLHDLRQRCHWSIRVLAERAGVSVGYVSGVEAGKISPTLALLRKMLLALGTDIGPFFAPSSTPPQGHVFRRETMRTVSDNKRFFTLILPERPDIRLLMINEVFLPLEQPEFEALPGDLAGYVLQGEMILEVKGEEAQILRAGDAFYVEANRLVRGRSRGDDTLRVISTQILPSSPPGPEGAPPAHNPAVRKRA